MKLNPNAYVPTMLVKGNVPICESIDIIEYMDQNLNGKFKLNKGQPEFILERYKEFKALHLAYDIESFTLGSVQEKNWYGK